jgi:hypothetical protein
MARIRTIKPDIWGSEQLGSVSRAARLLFIGLITQADDEGRLKGSPRRLKATIFPYDDDIDADHIEGWLEQLSNTGLIVRYGDNPPIKATTPPENGGQPPLIYLPGWQAHQVINKPSKSKLPSPIPTTTPPDSGSTTGGLPVGREGKGEEGSGREGKGSQSPEGELTMEDAPLSHLLADKIAELDPDGNRPKVTKRWVQAEDRMLRIDKRRPEEARRLLLWTMADPFWRGNVLSMPKFREKYTQLYAAASRAPRRPATNATRTEERMARVMAEIQQDENTIETEAEEVT